MTLNDKESVEKYGFWYGYDWVVWICILLQSYGGMLVALVVKYADNVLKGFATSISILLTISINVIFFDALFGPLTVLGSLIVGITTVLFSELPNARQISILSDKINQHLIQNFKYCNNNIKIC